MTYCYIHNKYSIQKQTIDISSIVLLPFCSCLPPIRSGSFTKRVNQVGFTLLELMVVVTIIVFSVMVVAPNLGARLQVSRLDSSAAKLDALVRHARSRAIIEQQAVVLTPAEGGRFLSLDYQHSAELTLRSVPLDLGENVRLRITRNSKVDSKGVLFSPDGTADQAVFILLSEAGVRRMHLDPARGRVFMEGS